MLDYQKFTTEVLTWTETQTKSIPIITYQDLNFVSGLYIKKLNVDVDTKEPLISLMDDRNNIILKPVPLSFLSINENYIDNSDLFLNIIAEAKGKVIYLQITADSVTNLHLTVVLKLQNEVLPTTKKYNYQTEVGRISTGKTLVETNENYRSNSFSYTLDADFEKVVGITLILDNSSSRGDFIALFKDNGDPVLRQLPLSIVNNSIAKGIEKRPFLIDINAKGQRVTLQLVQQESDFVYHYFSIVFKLEK